MRKNVRSKKAVRLVSFLLMISMLASAACGMISAETGGAPTPAPEITSTDTNTLEGGRGTVTTEKGTYNGADYTAITYDLKGGKLDPDGDSVFEDTPDEYLVHANSVANGYYGAGWTSDLGGSVVYRFPLVFADALQSLTLEADIDRHLFTFFVGFDNSAEAYGEAVETISTGATGSEEVKYVKDISEVVAEKLQANPGAAYVYIKFAQTTDANQPRVRSIKVKAEYNVTWTETVATDSEGAAIKTVKKGNDYTAMTYSMTAGTEGTSGNYCTNIGNVGKATATSYCGGGGAQIVYCFPLIVQDDLASVGLSATISDNYGIHISVDSVTWKTVDIGSKGKNVLLNYDISDTVKELLTDTSATNIYVKFFYGYWLDADGNYQYTWNEDKQQDSLNTEWNAPVLYDVTFTVGYNTQWNVESELDGRATIETLVKGQNTPDLSDDFTKMTYTMDAGYQNGAEDNYCVNKGRFQNGANANFPDSEKYWADKYCGGTVGVTYKFPLLYQDKINAINMMVQAHSALAVQVSIDNTNWTELYRNKHIGGQDSRKYDPETGEVTEGILSLATVALNLTDTVERQCEGKSASAIYIRFFFGKHENGGTEWNAPHIHGLTFDIAYDCIGEYEASVDENGVSITTVDVGNYIKVATTHGLCNGADANYLVTEPLARDGLARFNSEGYFLPKISTASGVSNGYYTDWNSTVVLKYEIDDPEKLEEFVWEGTLEQRVLLQVSTNKKLSLDRQYGDWETSDNVWTTVYAYDNLDVAPYPTYKLPDGKDDKGLDKQSFTINFSDYVSFDEDITTLYVRLKNSYKSTGYGGKITGLVNTIAYYETDTDADFVVNANPDDPTDMSFKSIIYNKGSIDPSNWLKLQYTVGRTGDVIQREIDTSWIDVEWFSSTAEDPFATSLGAKTPTAIGTYAAKVNANPNSWKLRFENIPTLTVTGFTITCDHSFNGHDCDETDHWVVCDGCGEILSDATPHTQENAYYGYSEDEHWLTCECQSYDYIVEGHNWGIWDWTMMNHWRSCKDCGYAPEQTLHTYDDGVITLAPTLTERGVMTYTCECGYTKTQKIDKLTEEEAGALEEDDGTESTELDTETSDTSDVGGDEGDEVNKTTIIILSIICGVLVVGGVAVAVVLVLLKKRRAPKAPDPTEPADEAAVQTETEPADEATVAETAAEGETVEQAEETEKTETVDEVVETPESELSEADNIIKEEKVEKTSGKSKKKSKEKPEKQPKVKPQNQPKAKPQKQPKVKPEKQSKVKPKKK